MQGEFNAGIEARLAALEAQAGTISDTQAAQIKQSILDSAYPVGSIYTSVNTTNPGTLFGGTWERLKGKFLLGADDSTYKNGGTGGAATINLEHSHTTGDHKLTVDEMPSHNHGEKSLKATFSGGFRWYGDKAFNPSSNVVTNGISSMTVANNGEYHYPNGWDATKAGRRPAEVTINATHTHTSQGGGAAHNHGNTGNKLSTAQSIMPPYLVVYMWKRTA